MRRAGTGFFDGLYSLPGGHVEAGESVRQTAARELLEETGLAVHEDELELIGVVHRLSDTNRVDFFVRARDWRGEPVICEPHKCDHLGWFERSDLPADIVPYVLAALSQSHAPWILEKGWQAAD